jgi:hypothetical protein
MFEWKETYSRSVVQIFLDEHNVGLKNEARVELAAPHHLVAAGCGRAVQKPDEAVALMHCEIHTAHVGLGDLEGDTLAIVEPQLNHLVCQGIEHPRRHKRVDETQVLRS